MTKDGSIEDAPSEGNFGAISLVTVWALVRQYWWVFVIVMSAAGGLAYLYSVSRTPIYAATAKVLVQSAQVPGSFSAGDIEANRRFAEDFRDLLATRDIRESVGDLMELKTGSRALGTILTVPTRSIVSITVQDPDAQRAADVANGLAEETIQQVQRRQLTQIAQLRALLRQIGVEPDATLIAGQAATLSTLSILEEAIPAATPLPSRTLLNVSLAVLVGFVLVWIGIALREYFDDRVRSLDQLRDLTGVPNISDMLTIGSVIKYSSGEIHQPLILDDTAPRSLIEAYQFLQTNLYFAAVGNPEMKSILITSSNPEEGKTTTAANLAASIAKEGTSSVILVDTDLRRPALHRIFDIDKEKGFTRLILGTSSLDEVAVQTAVEGLRVIPSGPIPPDPPRLLRSQRMMDVVAELEQSADIILFDSPPLLAVADAMITASLVDTVLLVVESGVTRRELLRLAIQMIQRAEPKLIVTVLNKVVARGRRGYGGYGSYYGYGHGDSEPTDGAGGHLVTRALAKLRIRKTRKDRGSARSGAG